MKLSEVDSYDCLDAYNYKVILDKFYNHGKVLENVSKFIENLKTKHPDDIIQFMYQQNVLDELKVNLDLLYSLVQYGSKTLDYVESYKGWYKLIRDVEVEFDFSIHNKYNLNKRTIVYKKGSYIKNLTVSLEEDRDYAYSAIPKDAVEKVGEDLNFYCGEDGNEYYANWGEWKEDLQKYEFEDNPIRTKDRVYFE